MALSGDARFGRFRVPSELADHSALEAKLVAEPAHVSWTRLEPMPATTGEVDVGLAAPLADPLWLLTRQRQFGELAAEDGGSPIEVRVEVEYNRLDRIHRGVPGEDADVRSQGLEAVTILEAEIEAEADVELPESLRAEAGQQLLRLLRAADASSLQDKILEKWAFGEPSDELRAADPAGAARRILLAGRVPDGGAVVAELVDAGTVSGREMLTLGGIQIPARLNARVRRAVTDWKDWFDGYLFTPDGASAWRPDRLAYSCAVSTVLGEGEVTLQAQEYQSGTVDWYSFDHDGSTTLGDVSNRPGPTTASLIGIPQPARYPGMPAERYWEFEDTAVFFGGMEVGAGDLATLALIDFAVRGSTDWFQVPLEIPVGALVRISEVVVTTTFGEEIVIPAAINEASSAWTAFELASVDPGAAPTDLFLNAQTGRQVLVGPPLEEVDLVRDEMANLVWAIEYIVQGPTGAVVPFRSRLVDGATTIEPSGIGDAELDFRLMSDVGTNWHPLVPVAVDLGTGTRRPVLALELRPMLGSDGQHRPGPLGRLLQPPIDAQRLRVDEESIPREGLTLTRHYEFGRTSDGGSLLWVGRRNRISARHPASELRFDITEPTD